MLLHDVEKEQVDERQDNQTRDASAIHAACQDNINEENLPVEEVVFGSAIKLNIILDIFLFGTIRFIFTFAFIALIDTSAAIVEAEQEGV
jgi:hypothetical protein